MEFKTTLNYNIHGPNARIGIGNGDDESLETGSKFEHIFDRDNTIHKSNEFYLRILGLFALSNLWTLLLTFIPVLININPQNYYDGHPGWYTGADVMRFIEPVGGLLFQVYILKGSGLLSNWGGGDSKNDGIFFFLFFLGASVYVQGAAFHSASNMFKNAFEDVMSQHDDAITKDLYYWLRMVWEHEVSHYLYAAGYAVMAVCQVWAYRNHTVSTDSVLPVTHKLLLIIASIISGVLLCGVAVDFPSGITVALIYLIVYGLGGVGGYVFYVWNQGRDGDLYFGQRPILHYFLLSYVIGLVLLCAWIGFAGGIKQKGQVMD